MGKRKEIVVKDIDSFFLDKVLYQVLERMSENKDTKKMKNKKKKERGKES